MSDILLRLFLYADIFVVGALTVITVQHGRAHYKLQKHGSDDKPHLSAETKERMLKSSEEQYQKVLERSVGVLQKDLEHSAEQINGLVTRFAGVIVGDEMEKYRTELAKLHQQAEADMSGIKQEIAGHQAEIEAAYKAELEAEKAKMIQQIDLKLGDAVGSFLVEALQHNIDLGAQGEYLISLLEEHKSDFSSILTAPDPSEKRISSVSAVNVPKGTPLSENETSTSLPNDSEAREVERKSDPDIKQEVAGGQTEPSK